VADFIVTDHGSTPGVTNNPNTDIAIGSLVIVFVQERTSTGNYGTIADTNGNTWTRANIGHPNNLTSWGSASIWYCLKTTQLITIANSVTYTPIASTNAIMVSMISATYAAGSTCTLDINQTPQTGASAVPAIQSGPLNYLNELVVAAIAVSPMGASDTFTQVAGWSNGPDHQYYNIGGQAGATGVCGGNIQVTGTSSVVYNPTILNRAWVAMMLSFHATRAPQTFQQPLLFSNGQVGGINKQSGKKIIL
jgi:hypothetical protein